MSIYLDHINTCLKKLRETPITTLSTDTSTIAYDVQTAVQRAVQKVWNSKTWAFRKRTYTVTTVSGTRDYVLPKYIGEIYKITSNTAPYILTAVSDDLFDTKIPNPTSSGNPFLYCLYEFLGCQVQPTSAASILVVSTSASDTTQQVLIKGIYGGEVTTETVQLNGLISVGTSRGFTQITSITLSAPVTDRLIVYYINSSLDQIILCVFGSQERSLRFRKIRLEPNPSSVITLTVKCFATTAPLQNALEDTEIPDRWDYVVDQYAFAMALQCKGQDQSTEFVNQMNVANAYLDDMIATEKVSSEEPVVPLRFGDNGAFPWTNIPAGFGFEENIQV